MAVLGDTSALHQKILFHVVACDVLPTRILPGIAFTKLGFIINWLWFDLVFYGWYRAKQMIGDDE